MTRRSEVLAAAVLCAGLAFGACGEDREREAPVELGGLSAGGRRTYASASHTCAIRDGSVSCWGAADRGQTGAGVLARRQHERWPVGALPPARAVAAGGRHTCVSSGDAVYCFGDNSQGQGGVARPFILLEPIEVPGLPAPVTALAAGLDHSCAIAAGAVWCWGRNEAGESGWPPRDHCREPFRERRCSIDPARVGGLAAATDLALGDRHSCAIAGGEVWCWGANGEGQLGDGTLASRARPARVVGLPGPAAAIAAGAGHSCALISGEVFCWGATRVAPVAWPGAGPGLRTLAAGGDRTCAAGQRVWCGAGDEAPRPVAGIGREVRALAVSLDHVCVREGETVRCWGENDFGQLGTGIAAGDRGAARVPAWDGGLLRDVNGDGRVTLVCLGDSNTESMAGAWPAWCDRMSALLPSDFEVVNRGLGGVTASDASLLGATAPVSHAIENDSPEVAVLAYGTNDLLLKAPAPEVAGALAREAERLRLAGALPLVALVPPVRSDDAATNQLVRELNDALRDTFPAERIIDFASDFSDAQLVDRVHFDEAGQARRAALVADAIAHFLPLRERPREAVTAGEEKAR